MTISSTVGIQSWARRLEHNTRLFSKLTGMVTQRSTMLPHKTLLRPVHPFTGKLPTTQASNKQGSSPIVSLRKKPTVKEVVKDLSDCLRLCHRKNVEWLELTPSHHTKWLQYAHDYLIFPMLQLFRQLRVSVIKDDMFSRAEQDNDGIIKVWFTSLDFDTWEVPVYPPTIFITPRLFPSLVNTEAIARAVSPILCHVWSNCASKTIFTDLKTVLVIHPQTNGGNEVQVEIVPLKDDLRAFRIIATAYLLEAMPQSTYLNPPKEPKGKYLFWLPSLLYDDKPLTDEEVFRTKHRISDFNILKLVEDREDALQFFRWKLQVEKVSPKITSAGDILECTTNEFDQRCHPPRGVCSKPNPLPTLQHIENILRPNPLSSVLRSTLNDSKRFTIKLGRALGDSNLEHAITRVHLCVIETIDGHPIRNCLELVMKIFDDRFMEVPDNPYNEDGVLEDNEIISPDLWFQSILTAEWHVRGELTAFEKMEMAQGSLIPYFYGAHKFRLANHHEVFGVLMEYIDAPLLASGVASKWSQEHRGQLMTSIRHGLGVMQCADISQHDWHSGQILCNLTPSSQAHAVLIDFSATTQTLDLNVDLSKDDYGRCVAAVALQDCTGLDSKWVCEYWDRAEMKREIWDTNKMHLFSKGYSWSSSAVDPYKFVYDGLD